MPYTARTGNTGNLTVDITRSGYDGTEGWQVVATAPFSATDYDSGAQAGDGTVAGTQYVGREYTCTFAPVSGHTTPSPVTLTENGTPQAFDGVYISEAVTGDITVTPTQPLATWTLTGTAYDSGQQVGTQTLVGLDYGTYTATFDDNLIDYTAPAPDIDTLASPTLDMTGDYGTQRTDQLANIAVDVQLDGAGEGGTEPWTIRATSTFDGSDFTEAGVGDAPGDTTLVGPFWNGRDYEITFEAVVGYVTPVAVTITASGTPQTFTGNYITGTQVTRDIDANGWSLFFPAGDTRQIHVSNAGNDTTGDGSEGTPYLTVSRGQADIRSGFADWLLLRRGDTFYETLGTPKSGRSRTEPTLYGSYGASSDRPELWTNQSQAAIGGYEGSGPKNVCFVGIKFYSYTRDPVNNPGDYLGGNSRAALSWGIAPSGTPNLSGVLFEDCWFQFYHSMSIYGSSNGNISFNDLMFRRTLFTDFWIDEPGTEHSEAFYSRNATMQWHQCILDHNGWLIQGVSPGTDGTDGKATYFNHNTYFARNCSETEIIECVSMRPSANHNKWTGEDGAGSVVDLIEDNNLKIDGEIGIDVGGNSSAAYRFVNPTITNNVLTESGRSNSTGRNIAWGIETADWDGGTCSGNLVVHQRFSRSTYPISLRTTSGSRNWSFNNNIVHGMASAGSAVRVIGTNNMTGCTASGNILQSTHSNVRCWDFDGSTSGFTFNTDEVYSLIGSGDWHRGDGSVKTTAEWNTDTGDSATASQTTFVDDTRSIATYMTHIGESPATVDQFYILQSQQSKANWRAELTAPVINDWFRAGFTKV